MGMYTQLHLDVELKKDTPKEIIDTLTEMVKGECEKWNNRLNWCFNSSSCYFNNFAYSKLWKDEISNSYKLFVHCDFKNYDNEIEILLEWLKPHIENNYNMLGYTRYEEFKKPTILYYDENLVLEEDDEGLGI